MLLVMGDLSLHTEKALMERLGETVVGDLASLYGMPITQALNCLNQKEIEPPHKAQYIERHRGGNITIQRSKPQC